MSFAPKQLFRHSHPFFGLEITTTTGLYCIWSQIGIVKSKKNQDKMANAADYKYDFFNVTFPAEYVAHVEINRPEKLNAFHEV